MQLSMKGVVIIPYSTCEKMPGGGDERVRYSAWRVNAPHPAVPATFSRREKG
jgi:hypothetical protein